MARTEGTYVNPTHSYYFSAKFVTAISAGRTTGALKSPTSAASSTSPISTYSITIGCPDYAVEFDVIVSAEVFISEDVNFRHYHRLVANTPYTFGCGELDDFYIAAGGADTTIQYCFKAIA